MECMHSSILLLTTVIHSGPLHLMLSPATCMFCKMTGHGTNIMYHDPCRFFKTKIGYIPEQDEARPWKRLVFEVRPRERRSENKLPALNAQESAEPSIGGPDIWIGQDMVEFCCALVLQATHVRRNLPYQQTHCLPTCRNKPGLESPQISHSWSRLPPQNSPQNFQRSLQCLHGTA